ncbi:unnamed protein product [Lepeophtheirus salmonis]|uniref:(salmon louse) hypothetical protein n=1 Tax=Lepeophtheirus salmonis TaxID=72036 RepID=A0A7R8HA31_LEPSM|nr:unnamed protein product [Lepeophtheirus salmonis]CAF2970196.1 unnamed protein product [Lepeophtheirus salmonis]
MLKNEKPPQIDTTIENDTMVLNSSNESDSDEPRNPKLAVLDFNKCLSALGESPTKRKLTMEKGILPDPNPKRGSRIDEHVAQDAINFYKFEDVSRIMPGQKDTVSVCKNGAKIKKQKHLILCNLRENHHLFKQTYPQYKVGFSKFCIV